MKHAANQFNAQRWTSQVLSIYNDYEFLKDLIQETESIKKDLDKSLRLVKLPEAEKMRTLALIQKTTAERSKKALQTYSRQMVVVATSYIEAIILDFFSALFKEHPEKMHEFLNTSEGKNQEAIIKISLNDLITLNSTKTLLKNLVSKALRNVDSKKFFEWIQGERAPLRQRILMESSEVKSEIKTITGLRNRIVHNASKENVQPDQILAIFNSSMIRLLSLIEDLCKIYGIPFEPAANSVQIDIDVL